MSGPDPMSHVRSSEVSQADKPKKAAARTNVSEKPAKKELKPEISEPVREAIPKSALYTPKE